MSATTRKNKGELVASAVDQYMKKRQYVDPDGNTKRTEIKLTQFINEMAVKGSVEKECSSNNIVSFNCINMQPTDYEHQFSQFKQFVANAIEPMKTELTYLLFPLFLHLYLELVNMNHQPTAKKFYNRHKSLFCSVERYGLLVEELAKISEKSDTATNPKITSLLTNKYVVSLSNDAQEYLINFLKSSDNVLILAVINRNIDIKIKTSLNGNVCLSDWEEQNESTMSTDMQSENDKPSEYFQSLAEAVRNIKDSPPPLPSICMYSVMNTNHGLCSSAIPKTCSMLACGYEDSSVRIWKLDPQPFPNSKETNTSNISLACNDYNPSDAQDNATVNINDSKVLRGHCGSVFGTAFTTDGKVLLSCSDDTTIRAWDLTSFSNTAVYKGHSYPVWNVCTSPQDMYFATGSHDSTARLWNFDRTYPIRIFAGHSLDVDTVSFHPNGNYLATGSSDGTVRLWSVQDGKTVRIFQGHKGSVYSLAFSPNGELLSTAGEDGRIRIWDLAQGTLLKELLRAHSEPVYTMTFNHDSRILASGGIENVIRLWDVRRGVSFEPTSDTDPPELLGAFPTKSATVQLLHYSIHNCLLSVGKYSL